MNIKTYFNNTTFLALSFTASLAICVPQQAHSQSYGEDIVDLEVNQIDEIGQANDLDSIDQVVMPEPSITEAPEVLEAPVSIKETTPADLADVIGAASPEASDIAKAPSSDALTSEVSGLTDTPVALDADEGQGSDNNEFFDSFAGDQNLMGNETPRRVNPKFEPGSKFIIVREDAAAGSQQAMLTAANRALSLGRYSAALEMFEKLRKRSPRDKNILMGLGIAQQNMGFYKSAIASYRSLLKIDPRNVDAKVNMLGLLQRENPALAIKELKHLREHNPRDAGIAAQIGMVSAELGNVEDAVRYLGVASSIEPTNPIHVYNMAVIYDRAGASKDAVKLYEQALQLDVSSSTDPMVDRDTIYDRLATLRRL